jgi:hypothetical protein
VRRARIDLQRPVRAEQELVGLYWQIGEYISRKLESVEMERRLANLNEASAQQTGGYA